MLPRRGGGYTQRHARACGGGAAMSLPTYANPVWDGYFADPFLLRIDGGYLAYGTGARIGERPFEVLHSPDLVHWTSIGGALEPLDEPWAQDYWAPEVAASGGRWFMYYSVGEEDRGHLLRVAVADDPAGPFHDQGTVLTPDERFAIDAHPFRDDDGQWYLYYAHDVLEGDRVGTTVAVDRLLDMTRLEGDPQTLLRASGDWQLFRAGREMYGQVYDWYTLEGPFVRKRGGRYHLLYSGGAWEEPTYGVSYAIADHPLGPFHEPVTGPVVLQTVPDRVLGPGHCSVVQDADGADWIAYHAWDPGRTRRQMWIDRLVWGPDGPERSGPTTGPRLAPRPA
jgi:arabinan endo-1,5-alpha-L-arabinosidase